MRKRQARGRQALRRLFAVGGSVATAAGVHTMLTGGRSVVAEGPASPNIESELRFYGAFYAAYGIALLRLAPRADEDPVAVGASMGALFAAGVARATGWRAVGRPHPVQQVLLAIELGIPPAVVAWQSRLEG